MRMSTVLDVVLRLPMWSYAAAGAAVVAIILAVLVLTRRRRAFIRRLRLAAEDPLEAEIEIAGRYSTGQLLRRSRQVEAVARRYSPAVVAAIGMDELWQARLRRSPNEADLRRVLDFSFEKGLFTCFQAALAKPKLRAELFRRLDDSGDLLVLRRIALAGRGEAFDGHAAFEMLSDRIEEIRDMTGDPDWPVRYFAVKILLYDHDPRSERAIWESAEDASASVRQTVAGEFEPGERSGLFEHLQHLVLDDPSYEVRRTARNRIEREFSGRWELDPQKLSNDQVLHALEQLHEDSPTDEDLAVRYLESKSRELRLPAARFLDRIGALSTFFAAADLGDRQSTDRNTRLLENAVDVHVTGFLESARTSESVASLLLAARLLARKGPIDLIRPVAANAVAHLENVPEARDELFDAVLVMIEQRGDEAALKLLRDELLARRHEPTDAERILSHVPPRAHLLFSDAFRTCLTDADFAADEALSDAMVRMPYPDLIGDLADIVQAGPDGHPRNVRIRALKALGAYGDAAVLQFVLENLSLLPHDEAREFARLLAGFAGKSFDERAEKLLSSNDAAVRSALISALPATGKEAFLKQIREAVGDADPDVRIAAVWALADFEDKRSLGQAADKLRDPVERVRREAAQALGAHGGEATVKQLRDLIADENEVETVKKAALEGLAASGLKASIDILVDTLEQGGELEDAAVHALARKRSKRDVEAIVEHMKDAEPSLRERLTKVFQVMSAEGEEAMVELLGQDIPSLRPFITEVLEKVGYVDSLVRRLAHRDPEVRRRAAEILSSIGTLGAFRGIVLAARDPDQEVRVKVTKALEALETESGSEILAGLESDPDKRVRKYTAWARQRLKAKSL